MPDEEQVFESEEDVIAALDKSAAEDRAEGVDPLSGNDLDESGLDITDSDIDRTPKAPAEAEDPGESDVNPNDLLAKLPEEATQYLKLRERQMQAQMTRRTQEAAETKRRLEEQFGDLDYTQEAVHYYERLHNDPQFALQQVSQIVPALAQFGMKDQLQQVYESAGFSPAQAAAQANQDVLSAQEGDGWGDPEQQQRVDLSPFDNRLQSLEQQLVQTTQYLAQQQEQQQAEYRKMAVMGELQRQHNIIQQQNPDYTDDDYSSIYDLAYSTNGDLLAAQERYETGRVRWIEQYLSQKADVNPSAIRAPSGETVASEPTEIDDIKTATEMALQYVRNVHVDDEL